MTELNQLQQSLEPNRALAVTPQTPGEHTSGAETIPAGADAMIDSIPQSGDITPMQQLTVSQRQRREQIIGGTLLDPNSPNALRAQRDISTIASIIGGRR